MRGTKAKKGRDLRYFKCQRDGRAVRGAGGCSPPTSGRYISFGKEGLVETWRSRDASFMSTAPPDLHPGVLCGFLRLFPCLYIFLCVLLLLHYMMPRHQFPHQHFPTSRHTSLLALVLLSFSERSWSFQWKAINFSRTRTKTETTPPHTHTHLFGLKATEIIFLCQCRTFMPNKRIRDPLSHYFNFKQTSSLNYNLLPLSLIEYALHTNSGPIQLNLNAISKGHLTFSCF